MTIQPKQVLPQPLSIAGSTITDHSPSEEEYNPWRVIPVITLLSIATIIGSGILALPVTLHHTSLQVFLVVFTIAYVAYVGSVYAVVEVFQRITLHLSDRRAEEQANGSSSSDPSSPMLSSTSLQETSSKNITLFAIADMYLPSNILIWLFHICALLSFLGLIMSYGLAGPQALWQVLYPPPASSFPPVSMFFGYSFVGVIAVIFFMNTLLPVFSSLTILKGLLFIGVVVIVAALPQSAHVTSFKNLFLQSSSFLSGVEPFLVAMVALGGLSNTMPVMYALLPEQPSRRQIKHFRASVLSGLTICYLLNVGWVVALIQVVPRDGKSSLSSAYVLGQISTVPLVENLVGLPDVSPRIIHAVTLIVQLFILVSAAVSFFIISAGFKSYIAGVADGLRKSLEMHGWYVPEKIARSIAYTLVFGTLIFFIVKNPNGFLVVLTRLGSLTLSAQSCFLVFVILYYSRIHRRIGQGVNNGEGDIKLEMSRTSCAVIITLGLIISAVACILAIAAPFLGIEARAGE